MVSVKQKDFFLVMKEIVLGKDEEDLLGQEQDLRLFHGFLYNSIDFFGIP